TAAGVTSGLCGAQSPAPLGGQQGRCGFGPRQPFMVISPYAKQNAVDHNISQQGSVLNFIEYNWKVPAISGAADQVLSAANKAEAVPFDIAGMFNFAAAAHAQPVFLDPTTGKIVQSAPAALPWAAAPSLVPPPQAATSPVPTAAATPTKPAAP